ncbi:MAG: SDR family oxidoreductase [Alphaproteobacteria bacterium]|nr:SDR family oxidoreductase [Alphaproteobacteria bacterium]
MRETSYRTALVTGASSGIGAAIVRDLARRGLEVHAVARRRDALTALARETGCIAEVADVTRPEDRAALLRGFVPDILVNNAGTSRGAPLSSAAAADIDVQVEVNLRAVLHLLNLALPRMRSRGGHVVTIGSIAGLHPLPGSPVYAATKAAIHAMHGALRLELVGSRVRLTEICPGRVDTEIFGHAAGDAAKGRAQFLDGYEVLRPEDVAAAVWYAVSQPPNVNVGLIELTPTLQAVGGLQTLKPQ